MCGGAQSLIAGSGKGLIWRGFPSRRAAGSSRRLSPFVGEAGRGGRPAPAKSQVWKVVVVFFECKLKEKSFLKMTGLICGVINQIRNPRRAASPVESTFSSRFAADVSLILPDKARCWSVSLASSLLCLHMDAII